MGLESASFLSGLNSSNPAATDLEAQGDDHLRLIKTVLLASFPGVDKATYLQQAQADLASATTTDIGAQTTDFIRITGTTTITGLGTVAAGVRKVLRFAAALVLTYHASNLILPGAASITTAAGDTCEAISLGSGAWIVTWFQRASGVALAAFASGTIQLFGNSTAPTGWTKGSTHNDKALRLVTGTPSTGGSTAFSSILAARTIVIGNLPDFSVTITDPGHTHSNVFSRIIASNNFSLGGTPAFTAADGGSFGSNTTGISAAFGTAARGGAQSTMDFAVQYVDVILATKD